MKNNAKRKIKKDIRFDDFDLNVINHFSKISHFNFSKSVRFLIDFSVSAKEYLKPIRTFDDNDKRMLCRILILYSRSSTNINQIAHAINVLKNLSWIDLDHDSLLNKLSMIEIDLDDVRKDFNKYQFLIKDLIDSQNELKR